MAKTIEAFVEVAKILGKKEITSHTKKRQSTWKFKLDFEQRDRFVAALEAEGYKEARSTGCATVYQNESENLNTIVVWTDDDILKKMHERNPEKEDGLPDVTIVASM